MMFFFGAPDSKEMKKGTQSSKEKKKNIFFKSVVIKQVYFVRSKDLKKIIDGLINRFLFYSLT